MAGSSLWCKNDQEVQMSDESEVEAPKSLMVVLWLIAVVIGQRASVGPYRASGASYDRGKYAFQPVLVKLVE